MQYTPPASELNLRQQLINAANSIVDTSLESLVQKDKYGLEGGFVPLGPLFVKTQLLFKTLASTDLDLVSEAKLSALIMAASEIQSEFHQIRTFAPRNNPTQERSGRMEAYKQAYDLAYDRISPILAPSRGDKLAASESEASKLLSQINLIKETATKEIQETMTRVREVAKDTGIVEHAKLFKDEADKHNSMSRRWLGATVVLAVGTGALAWINYNNTFAALQALASAPSVPQGTVSPPGMTTLTIQLAVAKVIAFSILFSSVLWAGRVYRSHRHNYVVNRHRQNALGTFDVFVKSASADDQTKNAVLLQATQCIFNPQNTGYLQGEKETEGSSQLIEIVRNIPSAKA